MHKSITRLRVCINSRLELQKPLAGSHSKAADFGAQKTGPQLFSKWCKRADPWQGSTPVIPLSVWLSRLHQQE